MSCDGILILIINVHYVRYTLYYIYSSRKVAFAIRIGNWQRSVHDRMNAVIMDTVQAEHTSHPEWMERMRILHRSDGQVRATIHKTYVSRIVNMTNFYGMLRSALKGIRDVRFCIEERIKTGRNV